MSCNCGNSFYMHLPGYKKPVEEKPKVKIVKKKKPKDTEEQKPDEPVL